MFLRNGQFYRPDPALDVLGKEPIFPPPFLELVTLECASGTLDVSGFITIPLVPLASTYRLYRAFEDYYLDLNENFHLDDVDRRVAEMCLMPRYIATHATCAQFPVFRKFFENIRGNGYGVELRPAQWDAHVERLQMCLDFPTVRRTLKLCESDWRNKALWKDLVKIVDQMTEFTLLPRGPGQSAVVTLNSLLRTYPPTPPPPPGFGPGPSPSTKEFKLVSLKITHPMRTGLPYARIIRFRWAFIDRIYRNKHHEKLERLDMDSLRVQQRDVEDIYRGFDFSKFTRLRKQVVTLEGLWGPNFLHVNQLMESPLGPRSSS
ncbi:hypothetical protein B0H66DRAFT_592695, partial [Apodospora peruviana]